MSTKTIHSAEDGVVSDGRLLERHRSGDAGAFPLLMRRYANAVYGYLVRCGLGVARREEAFLDVFCEAQRALLDGASQRTFKALLFAVAARVVRDHLQQRRAQAVVDISERREREKKTTPLRTTQARQAAQGLEASIAALPLPQREALTLCCVEQLSEEEAAAVLEMSVNTIKIHLRRARLALAATLAQRSDR